MPNWVVFTQPKSDTRLTVGEAKVWIVDAETTTGVIARLAQQCPSQTIRGMIKLDQVPKHND